MDVELPDWDTLPRLVFGPLLLIVEGASAAALQRGMAKALELLGDRDPMDIGYTAWCVSDGWEPEDEAVAARVYADSRAWNEIERTLRREFTGGSPAIAFHWGLTQEALFDKRRPATPARR